jgi:hypothetical protein
MTVTELRSPVDLTVYPIEPLKMTGYTVGQRRMACFCGRPLYESGFAISMVCNKHPVEPGAKAYTRIFIDADFRNIAAFTIEAIAAHQAQVRSENLKKAEHNAKTAAHAA